MLPVEPIGPVLPIWLIITMMVILGVLVIAMLVAFYTEPEASWSSSGRKTATLWVLTLWVFIEGLAGLLLLRDIPKHRERVQYDQMVTEISDYLTHPFVEQEKLLEAAFEDEEEILLVVAKHSRTPDEGLIRLASLGDERPFYHTIKMIVAGRKAPMEALIILLNDSNPEIARAARSNPSLPADVVNMKLEDILMHGAK